MTATLPASPELEWVLVPREPTPEMGKAGIAARQKHGNTVEGTYRAMLSASPPAPSVGDDMDRMVQIEKLIAELQSTRDRFGNTCVYIRRGGLSWGAVALNRRDDDKKFGVFDLQAQHDRDMMQRVGQVERLLADKTELSETVSAQAKTIEGLEREKGCMEALENSTRINWREAEAALTTQAAEVERLTGEVPKLKQFPSGDFDEEVARLIRCLQLPDFEAEGFTKACTDAANMLESLEWGNVDLRQGLATAESSLETARGALEYITSEAPWMVVSAAEEFGVGASQPAARAMVKRALAALPSPPITRIKGEG